MWQQENLNNIHHRLDAVRTLPDGIVFQKLTPSHIVLVYKEGTKLRLGLPCPISDMVQSTFNIDAPLFLNAPYNQAFLLSLLWCANPNRVFIAGVGGGCFPTVLHHYLPQLQLDCVEIDPNVVWVAQKYFAFQPDQRLTVTTQDARAYLVAQETRYDIMFLDIFMGNGWSPYHVVTQQFFELCRTRLQPWGVIAINIPHEEPYYAAKIATLQAVFQQVYSFYVELGNSVVIATNTPYLSRDDILKQTKQLQNRYKFEFSLLRRAQQVYPPDMLTEIVPHLAYVEALQDDTPPPDYPKPPRMKR